jgi:hypothetical protein
MSSTDDYVPLAGALFDEIVEPLARAKRAAHATPYFPSSPDARSGTYFERPSPVGRMTPADFEFPGNGSATGLIAELSRFWTETGEPELAAAAPRLVAIADAIAAMNARATGDVDIFCYTLF